MGFPGLDAGRARGFIQPAQDDPGADAMTWTYTEEYYKRYTRDTWNESAPEYEPVEAILDAWNPDLLQAAAPRAGERVLDVATGRGEPALTLARAVGPKGRVLGIDLSERMIDLATERAKRAGLDNLAFQVMDAEGLDVPHGSMDLVTCRFGLQIVTNPEKAIAEALAALRSGGRLAATVWGPGEKNPFIHNIIGPMLEFAEPDETGYLPTPYEMGGPGELVALLRAAGFTDAAESRVEHPVSFASEEAYLRSVLKGTPIGHSLSEEEPDVQGVVLARTKENLARHRAADGTFRMTGEAVVVSARRP